MTGTSLQVMAGFLRGTTLFSRFVLMFILARNASLEIVGLFGLYWAGLQLATNILPLDVYAQTSRLLLRDVSRRKEYISKHLGFIFLVLVVLGPFSAFAFSHSSDTITSYLMFFFAVHLIFEMISSEIGKLLIPLGKPLTSNVILFIRSASWVAPLVIALETETVAADLEVILGFWLFGSFISCIVSIAFLARYFAGCLSPIFNWVWCRNILAMSTLFFASTLVFRGVIGLDRFIIESIFGIESVAIYALFASVSLGVLGLIESGVSAWNFPKMVGAIQAGNLIHAKSILKKFYIQNFVASLVLMLGITFFFSAATIFFLDDVYVINLDVFYVIAFGVLLYCISMPFHYVIYGFQKDSYLFFIYLFSLLIMLFWAYLFMLNFGLLGGGVMLSLALSSIAFLRVLVGGVLIYRVLPTK